jgi:competence protein ComEC
MNLLALCAAVLVGVAVTDLTRPQPMVPWLLAAVLAGGAAVLVRHHPAWRGAALVACALSLGAARGSVPNALTWPGATAPPAVAGALNAVRDAARAGISRQLPEPQASLAAGVLLGGSGHLDLAFRRDLERSGLSHLVAIDGFKQVVVAAAVGAVATRCLGARLAVAPVLAAIGAYALVSGGHPSAVRAALMVALAQLAAVAGRLADPLTSLSLATLGMALVDPPVLLDLGLQLSVSATLGIVLLGPVVRRHLRLRHLPDPLAEPVGLTLAVTLGCLPVSLSALQVVSLVSPLAHVVAVPLVPVVLVTGALLAAVSTVPLPPLVTAVAWLTWLPTSLLAATIHVFGSLPGAAVSTGRLPPLGAVVLGGVLLGCGIWHVPELAWTRRAAVRWLMDNAAVLPRWGLIGTSICALALIGLLQPDGRTSVSELALSSGQAVFVRGPNGRTTLVVEGGPGGAGGRALASGVADHLAVWEHKLDQVIVLDPAAERAVGLTLSRYPADQFTRAGPPLRMDLGARQFLTVTTTDGRLQVSVAASAPALTSGLTTFAARPGSAD